MPAKPATIISDDLRGPMPAESADWRDIPRHHRYYGSSAFNGGERLTESRRGARARNPSTI
jgi:hypothetical protein